MLAMCLKQVIVGLWEKLPVPLCMIQSSTAMLRNSQPLSMPLLPSSPACPIDLDDLQAINNN
ncbi:hypothetical protein K443DRAFT_15279 [Laccaria amethystina LaAM-08-1]|uniref:Uncharacterized protein n=1 Tax=Laccaria amethystina LaAM-08-1 TaxID=1095629 RepID=A0A0C9WH13_9AGAR|nr:hypothetical protein K443DRAFT_15279 [Laccaria amethystina LaAM-08-1]